MKKGASWTYDTPSFLFLGNHFIPVYVSCTRKMLFIIFLQEIFL